MTHLENFRRMLEREGPKWLPLDLPMTPPIKDLLEKHRGTRDAVAAFDLDFRNIGVSIKSDEQAWRRAFARIGANVPESAEVGFAGMTHLAPRPEDVGEAYHFRQMLHPLESIGSLEELKSLPWPDVTDPTNYADLPQRIEKIHAEGRVAVGACAITLFENAWYVRGMDNLFMDLVEGNGIGDWLLDWFGG